MSADNVHFEAISQPRTLSADTPASQKGVYLFYNHTLIFRENILCTYLYFQEQHLRPASYCHYR